jgi:archaellin
MAKSMINGIIVMILLISILLIGITTAEVIYDNNSNLIIEENYTKIANQVLYDISTYIQIKDQKGIYEYFNGERQIEKIALYISPLVSQKIDLSKLIIQLDNGEFLQFLKYQGDVKYLGSNSIFNHPIWENLNGINFGFISIIDLDDSLLNFNSINDNSDNAYLVFRLPKNMRLEKHDKLIITLFPSTGIIKTIELTTPFSTQSIINFN